MNKKNKIFSCTAILLLIAILIFLFGLNENWVLSYYSNGIYPAVAVVLRTISGIFPFALGDLLYGILILFTFWRIFLLIKHRKKPVDPRQLPVPLQLLNVFLVLYIAFKLLWGLNYSRPGLSQQLAIAGDKYSVDQLVRLGYYFTDQVNQLQPQVSKKMSSDIDTLTTKAVTAYQGLAVRYTFLSYRAPSVKTVLSNWAVSKIGIEGYYNPLSGEANVNTKLVPWVLPFVTCHEMAHQLGVAREDEANLVAYLAGIHSHDANFRYSVNYNMLRYILFEIKVKSPAAYLILRNRIHPAVLANFQAENDFWKKYNGSMSDYMGVAFDKFLKLNNQKRGIKSYQDIVIWLWNYHKKELSD